MGLKIGGQIEKVDGREISYSEFSERYLAKNQPVLLTGLMDDSRACKDWVSTHGQPNIHFFSTHFGKSKVQVADCDTKEFTDQKRLDMSVSEFVNLWLQGSVEGLDDNGNGKSMLYFKDWHFMKEYPDDDWLNLYLDNYRMHDDPGTDQEKNDICFSDYRFVYMGAKGLSIDATISLSLWFDLDPGHLFVLMYSDHIVGQQMWCGKKKWLFLPSSQCHLLFDRMKLSLCVPSGWYHQVHNLEDTISINHNWFNGYNLSWVWDLLLKDYNEAKEYIEDIKDICDDFEGLCQCNLAANAGMNFNDIFIFISRFSLANVVELYYLHGESKSESRQWSAMMQHFALNLASIRKIALKMISEGGVHGNLGILDLRESLSDRKFLELCTDLGRIYVVIHEEEKWSSTWNKVWMADFEYGSQVCSPQDLVNFIDYFVSKLSANCTEQNTLLSVLHDAHTLEN